jgi:hypothetical protein
MTHVTGGINDAGQNLLPFSNYSTRKLRGRLRFQEYARQLLTGQHTFSSHFPPKLTGGFRPKFLV